MNKLKIIIFTLVLCGVPDTPNVQSIEPLAFDRLYPETHISRVLRTMKQLYATMHNIKEHETKRDDCVLAHIVEIQSLSVCGALQELERAMRTGLVVSADHALLINSLWKTLQVLAKDELIERYLHGCSGEF